MEFGTSAPAGSTPVLRVEMTPQEAVELLTDMKPDLTTTFAYDELFDRLERFARQHA